MAVGLIACWVEIAVAEVLKPGEVNVIRIDGSRLSGVWRGAENAGTILIDAQNGMQSLRLDDLARIEFREAKLEVNPLPRMDAEASPAAEMGDAKESTGRQPSDAGVPAIVHLPFGGRLYATLRDAPENTDAVAVRTHWGTDVTIPLDRLAAVQFARDENFPRPAELLRSAFLDRKPGEDMLITRGPDDAGLARGRVERLGVEGGSFVFADRTRIFRNEKLFAIVFAAGAGTAQRPPLTVRLLDGSVLPGRLEHADAELLRLETFWGSVLPLSLAEVVSISIASDRVMHLSDWTPKEERFEGRLHRSWPPRTDRNVSGGPLSIGGRVFEKGIGTHSRTELTYTLQDAYESFAATMGIDDSVRPRGAVVFRVIGDGKVLFDSGTITGADPPRDVLVNVAAVKNLTLEVDYGDELDLSDHADWGDARLIKPVSRSEVKTPRRSPGSP